MILKIIKNKKVLITLMADDDVTYDDMYWWTMGDVLKACEQPNATADQIANAIDEATCFHPYPAGLRATTNIRIDLDKMTIANATCVDIAKLSELNPKDYSYSVFEKDGKPFMKYEDQDEEFPVIRINYDRVDLLKKIQRGVPMPIEEFKIVNKFLIDVTTLDPVYILNGEYLLNFNFDLVGRDLDSDARALPYVDPSSFSALPAELRSRLNLK